MELRPFRAIRFSPAIIARDGLENLIVPVPAGAGFAPAAGEQALKESLAAGRLWKERRPGMWQQSQTLGTTEAPVVVRMLVGLVRVDPPGDVELPTPEPAPEARDLRLVRLRELKADFEPALILTRAPLTAALATTRRPDHSVTDGNGVRHDLLRITDYAEHVELQGLVKNAEASLVTGADDWEAAREFAKDAVAAKMPGARYKLSAIVEESAVGGLGRLPRLYAGFFGFSVEDPVY
ncbi:MAG: DUF1015 family protein [Thermoanaerobaculia bacterium]